MALGARNPRAILTTTRHSIRNEKICLEAGQADLATLSAAGRASQTNSLPNIKSLWLKLGRYSWWMTMAVTASSSLDRDDNGFTALNTLRLKPAIASYSLL